MIVPSPMVARLTWRLSWASHEPLSVEPMRKSVTGLGEDAELAAEPRAGPSGTVTPTWVFEPVSLSWRSL